MAARKNIDAGTDHQPSPESGGGAREREDDPRGLQRVLGISEHTYYRWRREYGGMNSGRRPAAEGAREGEPAPEASGGGSHPGQPDPEGGGQGKLLSPERRRRCVVVVRQQLGASERRACRVLGPGALDPAAEDRGLRKDEEALREDVVKLARRFGRYGYRMVTAMLRTEGWRVNHKRVERIWRQEGLKVPKKQPKRAGSG